MKETLAVELKAGDIDLKFAQIHAFLSHTEDLKMQKIIFNNQSCAFIYVEPLVKIELIQLNMIKPLLESTSGDFEQIVTAFGAKNSSDAHEIVQSLLLGFCVILQENESAAYMLSAVQTQGRTIEEPKDEQIIKGSHEGFIESLNTNIYLLRNRIKSPKLKVKYLTLGQVSHTKVAMVYMEDIADPKIVDECEKRVAAIELDYIYAVSNIDEMLEEHPLSPFPQTMQTERPDRAASYLMEGKINIIVDGTPSVLVLPITFFSFFQTPDDYNGRWIMGSFFRAIRFLSFLLAISLPAIYIAIVSYHSEVLPMGILYSVQVSLTYVPLPPILEALVMQIILELLKEASIRLPSPIAQTIGIVGGLVIGTAVVEAQLVSHTMIVVIGLTAIASFTSPLSEFGTSLRIVGFPTMLAAALFGFFGISIMMTVVFIHLCKMETLGVPYFAPFGPFRGKDGLKDMYLRLPIWKLNKYSRTSKSGSTKPFFLRRWKRT